MLIHDDRPTGDDIDDLDDRSARYVHGYGRHVRHSRDTYQPTVGPGGQGPNGHGQGGHGQGGDGQGGDGQTHGRDGHGHGGDGQRAFDGLPHHAHGHHGHAPHPPTPASRQAVRLVSAVLVPVALVAVAALVWLWPGGVAAEQRDPEQRPQRFTADVVTVAEQPCPPRPEGAPPGGLAGTFRCGSVAVQLTNGPERGKRVDTEIPGGPGAPTLRAGDHVVVLFLPDSLSGRPYQIIDHQRSKPLLALALAFVFAVVAFGRWRGLRALAGLAVTFSVLLLFIVPAILNGQ
ncbi:MAG TPA: YibE/F family protein, partial [Micromonosporaceae bacterium]|nr:YibE/F family protein [Micromonosporaceae bacterium]